MSRIATLVSPRLVTNHGQRFRVLSLVIHGRQLLGRPIKYQYGQADYRTAATVLFSDVGLAEWALRRNR